MTWKLTTKAEGMEPLPGVPWEDIDDARFKALAAEYDAQFEPGALAKSGFWEHVTEPPKEAN